MYSVGLSLVSAKINNAVFGQAAPGRGTEEVIADLMELTRTLHSDEPSGSSVLRSSALLLRHAVEVMDPDLSLQYADAAWVMVELYRSMTQAEREES